MFLFVAVCAFLLDAPTFIDLLATTLLDCWFLLLLPMMLLYQAIALAHEGISRRPVGLA
jgi:hypothetical protein